jgi:hypothetical protein
MGIARPHYQDPAGHFAGSMYQNHSGFEYYEKKPERD